MKKIILISALFVLVSLSATAQKIEVLYFKAQLSCCQATACNTLESDIQTLVSNKYDSKDVVFKEVKLADEANKTLVETYSAKSQTVVLVRYKKGKAVKHTDISQDVKRFQFDANAQTFEAVLDAKIKELL